MTLVPHILQCLPLVIEIVGAKDVWGKNEDAKGTNLAVMESLAFIDRAYLMYVGETHISIDRLSRTTPQQGRFPARM